MATLSCTDREIKRASQENFQAYNCENCNNAHRLLLFYAVECGLKAILMSRRNIQTTDCCPEISKAQHNINSLLDALSAGKMLMLPSQFKVNSKVPQGKSKDDRIVNPGEINQVWRYGGKISHRRHNNSFIDTDDRWVEDQLKNIYDWIKQEL